MPMTTVLIKVDPERVADCLLELKLDKANGETVLDFSSVPRIDAKGLQAMEALAGLPDAKAVKVGLRGVNVEIYKVLKLVKLTPRFSFLT
jgi:anti-anti-sigma regulatory factor